MLKNEFRKILKRKSTKVFGALYALIIIAITIGYFFGENTLGLTVFSGGQFIKVSLSLLMSFLLPFMVIYLVGTTFSIDLGEGTIKNMFLLPIKKESIFINKLLSVQAILGGVLGIHFIYSSIISIIQDGGFSPGFFISCLLYYLGAFVVLGLINLIGANLVLLVNSLGLTILITYLGYMGISFLGYLLPGIKAISISEIINSYASLFQSFNISLLLIIASYYIIFIITGSFVFEKKEESVCQYD